MGQEQTRRTGSGAAAGAAASASRRELAEAVATRLREAGHRALFAGGCVRDLLLGAVPRDYDVATSAPPGEVQALFARTVAVGAAFGVILVLPDGRTPVEVATFRRDLGYSDGRRPDGVAFADEREDARRRDFTINGLFLDPATGEVLDYVGGRVDLERRVVRAIGDPEERIAEDRLRMLRAVRFAAHLHFTLERATLEAIRVHAATVTGVSAERIRDELVAMLTRGDAAVAVELLEATGLLAVILPEVAALRGVEQPPEYHPEGDVWTHTLLLLAQLRDPSPTLALAALLHDIGKPATFERADRIRFHGHDVAGAEMARAILGRLRFPNEVRDRVVELVRSHHHFQNVRAMRPSRLKRFLRRPDIDELLELHRIDRMAGGGQLDNYAFCVEELRRLAPEDLAPKPLLTGRDLIAMGLEPGPSFAPLLREIEDAQLEGRIRTREDALAWVRSRHPAP